MSADRVVVLGGTGVFGSRLVRRLRRDPALDVLAASRRATGPGSVALDREAPDVAARLRALAPRVVVDASGPFQEAGADPYRVARATLAAGAHYVDLSDDAAFTAGIGALDTEARAAGLAVLSGASSVPAISSAAVEALRDGLLDLHLIESVILPGNRAPRGVSVMRAILTQVGRPLAFREGGVGVTAPAWSSPRCESLAVGEVRLGRRWSALIGAPDLALFPDRYGTRSVRFRAGLELGLLQHGLWALGWLVRAGLVRSLAPATPLLRRVAGWFEPFGTDRGGMAVEVVGRDAAGTSQRRRWTLIAGRGDGPDIPTLAAAILTRALMRGEVAPGARAAVGEVTLAELAREAEDLALTSGVSHEADAALFETALGAGWNALPAPLRDLHDLLDVRHFAGRATITRGRAPLARLAGWLVGFPPAAADVPVRVTMRRAGGREVWTRDFGGRRFRSVLSRQGAAGTGLVTERFGPLAFVIGLTPEGAALGYPVLAGRAIGIPLPRWLLPRSETWERVDAKGRATFDVRISLPVAGEVVRYRGWLTDAGRT